MAATAQEVLAHYGIAVTQQMGAELRCLCPFHEDHTPSLDMNSEKNMWVCRAGCGGGPLETFVMRMENVPLVVAKILLENDFVLYEGDQFDAFYRLCAEFDADQEYDAGTVAVDISTKRKIMEMIFHSLSITPELSPEFVNEWTRVLIYVMSDKETYPKEVYTQMHSDFHTEVKGVT